MKYLSYNQQGQLAVATNRESSLGPRDPITLSEDDWGVQSPPKRKVFRFHETILRRYHSRNTKVCEEIVG